MNHPKRRERAIAGFLLLMSACHAAVATQADDEAAIRKTLATFYEGWNEHDPDKMISTYAEDIDHINVFGEWHKGKSSIRDDIAGLHNGPVRLGLKRYDIEKIRFLPSDVAVVQVSSQSKAGRNIGTYVMQRQDGKWLTVSFTNVMPSKPPYKP